MAFVELAAGKVRTREGGIETPPVLFLHGAAGSSSVWLSTISRVAPLRRAIAFDFPGHGRSTGSCATFDDFVAVTADLAATLCLGKSILVGHSLGGLVALAVTLANPDKVAGLVLVTTAAKLSVSSRLLARISDDWVHWHETIEKLSYAPDTPGDLRRRSAGLAFIDNQAQTLADFQACMGFDARARLGEIACPTLVVAGRFDQMIPQPFTTALAEGIRGARLVELASGHFPMHEQADGFATALIDHIQHIGRLGTVAAT